MTKTKKKQIHGYLHEHFQAFQLIGFDMDGKHCNISSFTTDIQGQALATAARSSANQNTQAPEVWVRNLPDDDLEDWGEQ